MQNKIQNKEEEFMLRIKKIFVILIALLILFPINVAAQVFGLQFIVKLKYTKSFI